MGQGGELAPVSDTTEDRNGTGRELAPVSDTTEDSLSPNQTTNTTLRIQRRQDTECQCFFGNQ